MSTLLARLEYALILGTLTLLYVGLPYLGVFVLLRFFGFM